MKAHNTRETHVGEMLSHVMSMKGIPKHKHAAHIREVLDASTPQAQRKLKGHAPWELSQLEKVVYSLDLSMSQFFEMFENGLSEKHDAIFSSNKNDLPCKVYLLDEEKRDLRNFSAVKISDTWHIFRTEDILNNPIYMESKRDVGMIVINTNPMAKTNHRIALLDDDPVIVDTLKEYLVEGNNGYIIDKFYNISELDNAIKKNSYDAYILDWIVHGVSVFNTIQLIRNSQKPDAMIIALTGQVGEIVDEEIGTALNDFDVAGPYTKPLRYNSIRILINKYFSK